MIFIHLGYFIVYLSFCIHLFAFFFKFSKNIIDNWLIPFILTVYFSAFYLGFKSPFLINFWVKMGRGFWSEEIEIDAF